MISGTLFRANWVSKSPVVLALHGMNDDVVSVDMNRASRERLRDFGVRLMYRDLAMGQRCRGRRWR